MTKKEIESGVLAFASYFDSIGNVLEAWGNLEKAYGRNISELLKPEAVGEYIEKAPPEIAGVLSKLMFRVVRLVPRVKAMGELPPDEKLNLAKEFKTMAREYEGLINLVKKSKSVGKAR